MKIKIFEISFFGPKAKIFRFFFTIDAKKKKRKLIKKGGVTGFLVVTRINVYYLLSIPGCGLLVKMLVPDWRITVMNYVFGDLQFNEMK